MNKEQTKKLVLGGFGILVLLYVYFSFFLGPLHHSEQSMKERIEELQGKIASSKDEMAKAAKLEENARAATSHYDALRALSPEGAPIAWFPPRMKTFFAEQHIDKATARLEGMTASKEQDLMNWSRYTWALDLPQTDFVTLGNAIAALENSQPLSSIKKLTVRASATAPELQQVSLTISTIIDKK